MSKAESEISFTGFNTLSSSLKKIENGIKAKAFAKVGILGKTDNRQNVVEGDDESTSNASIGLKQEFGSVSENIHARSFLRFPLQYKRKDLIKGIKKRKAKYEKATVKGDLVMQLLSELGILSEIVIQKAFETSGFGQWEKNSDYTIAMKGSSKPLIDTGELRKAVISEVVNGK